MPDKSQQLWEYVNQDKNRFLKLNEEGRKVYLQYGWDNKLLSKDQLTDKSMSYINTRKKLTLPKPLDIPTMAQEVKPFIPPELPKKDYGTEWGNKHPNIMSGLETIGDITSAPLRALNKVPFLDRMSSQAANTVLMNDFNKLPEMKSKVANVAADIGGTIAGYGVGLPQVNTNLMAISDKLVGQKAGEIAGKATKNLTPTLGKAIERFASGGARAGSLAFMEGEARGVQGKELAKKVGTEALIGGGLNIGIGAVGDKLKEVKAKKDIDKLYKYWEKADEANQKDMNYINAEARFQGKPIEPLLEPVKPISQEPAKQALKPILEPPKVESILEPKTGGKIANIDEIVESSQGWKDKSPLSYGRETLERNFEDIAGKDAKKLKDTYVAPIKANEANRIRFLNKERTEIASLGIKAKSTDSKLLQEYGEGLISLESLKDKTSNWEKIVKANNVFRQKYDKYLNDINEVLTANGYDPIPRRKDYFKHFAETTSLLEQFGIPVKENLLPTDINGLTADFKPGKNFFTSALPRLGNKTEFDAIKGIDSYLEGASKLMYHTDDIQRLRQLEKAIRTEYAGSDHLANFVSNLNEYTNQLAGKKAMIDRGIEQTFGRKIYGITNKLKQQFGANMVGANISSGSTNFIPLTQAAATTDKESFVKGMMQTIGNVFKDDGFIEKSDFLTSRVGSDPLYRSAWQKVGDKSGWFFETVDMFTAQTVVRSKFLEGVKKGMPEDVAMQKANEWAAKMIADRSLGSLPTIFGSKTLGFLTQFQLEVNNQLSFAFKDIPRAFDKAGAAAAVGQLFVYSYLFNNLFEKATGRRVAFDPIGIAEEAYRDFNDPKVEKGRARKALVQNIVDELPFTSILTGGRIPVGDAMPNLYKVATGESSLKDELLKPAVLALPTGGAQLKKTYKGLTSMGMNPLEPQEIKGVYGKPQSGETYLKYPVEDTPQNRLKAALFGQSAFPESQEYYRTGQKGLTASQTRKVEEAAAQGKDPQKMIDLYMLERKINKLNSEIKETREDKELTLPESSMIIRDKMSEVRSLQLERNNLLRQLRK